MNLSGIIGTKIDQGQAFSKDGVRVPLSKVQVSSPTVMQVKTAEKDGYNAIKIGIGMRNKANKSLQGQMKKAGLTKVPRFLKEIRENESIDAELGQNIVTAEVLKPGDIVSATGTSKGKGYAGVVKKWNFRGGPRTHGQSDRERAPGSIGQSATPGRVYKGKKMSGRMGNEQVTITNLQIISVDGDELLIKGLIPGVKGGLVTIKKTGEVKNPIELFSESTIEESDAIQAAEPDSQKDIDEPEAGQETTQAEEAEVEETSEVKQVDEKTIPAENTEEDVATEEVPGQTEEKKEEK